MAGRLLSRVTRSSYLLAARGQIRQDHATALPAALRDEYYPKVGNRDIVGFGVNGSPIYEDIPEFPCPAVRFRENSSEIMALREKEKGDWHKLTLEEKKALYRASFRQTFAEIHAPTGEWKAILAGVLLALSVSGWFIIYVKRYVLPPLPHTVTREWQEKQLELMLKQRQNPIQGIASHWDYDNKRWK